MVIKTLWKIKSIDKDLVLRDNELHIWKTKISENKHDLDFCRYLLTSEELIHANEFYFVEDRNRYIIARAILRRLIFGYTGILPNSIVFEYTEYGKPFLAAKNNIQGMKFNIAHSKNAVVFAFTKNIDVGIDIEFVNKDFVIDDLVKYCCSEQEQYHLKSLPEDQRYRYFYKLWVIKEAIVKAMGLGLSYDLKRIYINFSKNKLIDPIVIINNDKMYWTVDIFLSYDGYQSAFATKNQIEKVLFSEL